MKEITDDLFEAEVVKATGPVLVDFFATWCGPCRQLTPILEELTNEMGAKIKIIKMDIDKAPSTPSKFKVQGVPTLMLFKDGKAVATKVGAMPKSKLIEWLTPQL